MASGRQANSATYRVGVTRKAEQDVDEILHWFLDQDASVAGERWFTQLMGRIATLEMYPERCSVTAESADLGVEVRELLFGKRHGTYRILFQLVGRSVHIPRVGHGARDGFTDRDL